MQIDGIDLFIHRLALQIADGAARTDIEINCPSFTEEGREPVGAAQICSAWYDLSLADLEAHEMVMLAAEYLKLRGLIVRHPTKKNWIRIAV